MHLEPFIRVNGTPFTASREDVIRAHGQPLSEIRNPVGLSELDYGAVVYRFHLGAVAVPFRDLAVFVRANDAAAFERADFLVSPLFGLAFVPGEPCWVTALARHCLGAWEALRSGLP